MSNWRRRVFTSSTGLTQAPPGPHLAKLARRWARKIFVTSPGFDNIGEVLASMNVAFEVFTGRYDCDLLFVNCGTHDRLDSATLRRFVEGGGCLYASDLTSAFIAETFPGMFFFGGSGDAGVVAARVIDEELRDVVGDSTSIHFDMGSWAVLQECSGAILVEGAADTRYAGKPLMVEVEFGDGVIFYTSFHNRAQLTAHEKVLLQLLVLKQMGAASNASVAQVGRSLGITITPLKMSAGTD
jgi:hypothetical protein